MLIRKRRVGLVLSLLIFFALFFAMHACMTFRSSPKEIDAFFEKRNVSASQHSYNRGFREIHYVESGDTLKPLVLFIHGSPGSLDAFLDFLADTSLITKARLVTTDRPGFGYSNFGNAEPSLERQAILLKPILERYHANRPIILVGHSLGGPLIVKMAMLYPDLVDGLVIVAGSVDPELEPDETWFRAPLATPFLSWILPRSFRASNEEIYQLKPALEKMLPYWKDVTCPVIVIQGNEDSLVPAANAEFTKKMLTNAEVKIVYKEDMDHFVPWSNPELINAAIFELIGGREKVAVDRP